MASKTAPALMPALIPASGRLAPSAPASDRPAVHPPVRPPVRPAVRSRAAEQRPGPEQPAPGQRPGRGQHSVPGQSGPGQSGPEQPSPGQRPVPEQHPAAGPPPAPGSGMAHAPTSGARAEAPAIPAHMLPQRTPAQLLAIARQGLVEAAQTRSEGQRYATAHMAALRAAAAVLAARARPAAPTRRSRVTSVWSLLVLVAPEFSEWASYFALGANKRAAAEAGIPRVVSPREADDLLRAAEQFVAVVESALGLSYQPPFPEPRLAA